MQQQLAHTSPRPTSLPNQPLRSYVISSGNPLVLFLIRADPVSRFIFSNYPGRTLPSKQLSPLQIMNFCHYLMTICYHLGCVTVLGQGHGPPKAVNELMKERKSDYCRSSGANYFYIKILKDLQLLIN